MTSDTVTKETLVKGTSAHNAAGERIEGVFDPAEYLKKTDDGSNLTVAFTEKATRENISTGEKMSVLMGKIKKFFADLTAPAFAQMITAKEDLLATKVTGYVPDAKAVADGFADVNGKLNNEYFSLQSGTAAITPAGTIASYDKASKKVFIAFVIFGSRKADEVIYVVPEKYRPSSHVQGVCILKTSEGGVTMGACSIKTNGYCVQNVTNADTNCVMCIFNYGI